MGIPRRHVVAFALLLSTSSTCLAIRNPDDLIGWSEQADNDKRNIVQHHGLNPDEKVHPPDEQERGLVVLSWEPRIFLYRGILTDQECDHMIEKAEPRLYRSGVVAEDGGDDISDIRTSQGMFYDRGENAVISDVERKLSEWSLIPVGNGEGIQVLKYEKDQEYKPHFDYFFHEAGNDNGGNRLATVLMYLSTPDEGGETIFPNVDIPPTQTRKAGFSQCAMEGLAVKPRKGDAVLFWSLRTDGTLDQGSIHGSCPVIRGTKYAATKWFHVGRTFVVD